MVLGCDALCTGCVGPPPWGKLTPEVNILNQWFETSPEKEGLFGHTPPPQPFFSVGLLSCNPRAMIVNFLLYIIAACGKHVYTINPPHESSPLGWHQFSFLVPYWSSVYPTDHVFIFFRIFIFLKIFLINISMKPEVTQTNYLYTWRTIECFHSIGPHADGIGPALGRQSVLQVCPPLCWLEDTN